MIKRKMSSVDLPNEMINKILLKMQSRILTQCKCVCKSWNALISNPEFIAQHLVLTQNQNDGILVMRGDPDTQKIAISLFSSEKPSEFQDLRYDTTFDNTEEGQDLRFGMTMLCCNHLLIIKPCFSTKVILWNPKETEFKILPECNIPLDPPDADRSNSVIGFGFDSETNDYKVVRMIKYRDNNVSYIVQTELYSLRTNSWRKLDAIPQIYFNTISMGTININGMFYWYGSTGVQKGLWSFDMSTELFDFTPLPILEDSKACYTFLNFFALHDRPAMIHIFPKKSFDVWVLLEHGVEESWTKLYSIPHLAGVRVPVGCGKNGELFMESEGGELWLYDPITHEIKSLNIRGFICSFQIVKYRG